MNARFCHLMVQILRKGMSSKIERQLSSSNVRHACGILKHKNANFSFKKIAKKIRSRLFWVCQILAMTPPPPSPLPFCFIWSSYSSHFGSHVLTVLFVFVKKHLRINLRTQPFIFVSKETENHLLNASLRGVYAKSFQFQSFAIREYYLIDNGAQP
jgi:hypothetical protein